MSATECKVSIPFRGSGLVKSSLRKPYRERVSDAKSTHLFLLSITQRLLTKISGFHRPKPLPRLPSTHLNGKMRVLAIA